MAGANSELDLPVCRAPAKFALGTSRESGVMREGILLTTVDY